MTNKRGAVSSNCQLDKKQLIRLWLELLKNTGEIERYLRTQLLKNFDSTLPQFDLLAVLDRADKPISKTELSHQMMVDWLLLIIVVFISRHFECFF